MLPSYGGFLQGSIACLPVMVRCWDMAYYEKEIEGTKTIWRETFEEINKWIKRIVKVSLKIGKWVSEMFIKISKSLWEAMDKKYGEKS